MRKSILLRHVCYILVLFSVSSCVNQKQIAYFQKGVNGRDTIDIAKAYIPKIQPGDILAINIGSLNPAASSFLNPYSTMSVSPADGTDMANSTGTASAQPAAPTYLVNTDGTIEIPLLGSIKLAGLTTTEGRDTIKKRIILKDLLKEPTVSLRFLNYKISILGEVARPSVYVIPNERITLPEALSMAGDLTILAKRNNIMIIRDVDGKKEFGYINLTSREIYGSPYYYLHANDVVYVEPSKSKIQDAEPIYKILPTILSVISVLVIAIYYGRHS